MAALIARNQSRASIQAIIDYVEDADFQNRNYVQLHNRFDYLLEQWTTFKENSNLVRVQANDDDEEERHAVIFAEMESLYLETKSVLEVRINQLADAASAAQAALQPEMVQAVQQEPREIVVRIDQPKRDIENTVNLVEI